MLRCVDGDDWTVNFLLRNIATSAMEQAVYFSTGAVAQEKWSHYGLALDKYTHFTSPIRRYADIIVHRSETAKEGELRQHDLFTSLHNTKLHTLWGGLD